jgi:hypothetical protein
VLTHVSPQDKSTLSEDKLAGLEEIVGEEADASAILKAAKSSMGMDTSPQDMNNIHIFTERMISLAKYRKEVLCFSSFAPASLLTDLSCMLTLKRKWLLLPPISPLSLERLLLLV